MAELYELTATEAAALMDEGEITSVELVESCLERISAREDAVQAWEYLKPDHAMAQAKRADDLPRRSPLHGIPFAAKDIIDTADMPTACGSPIYAGNRPGKDAACVTAMRDAGAVLMGKTVTTEFATFFPGKTRNAHHPDHTPGGSSSGSGAAVGASMVPLAFGTQTAGSLIRPAAYNGVCGLKPSFGTVDLAGVKMLDPGLDHLGYMARSFDDLAVYYDIVRGAIPSVLADGIGRAPRVGLCRTFKWDLAEPETVKAIEDAAAALAGMGAEIIEQNLPADMADIAETHMMILHVGLSQNLAPEWNDHRDQISDRLQGMIQAGFDTSEEDYDAAMARAADYRARADDLFGDCDIFLTPSAPGIAPRGLDATGDPMFQIPWTLLRTPCVTIPFATGPEGMPVGVQMVARPGEDEKLLAIAKWFHGRM
jgi:Asp-tRNA(Asn)/Glu-tRNA(Gln) amidotransferase A subunit family amidase